MRQRGFTILEVLVALVITSIGLIGLVGLTMTSAKNNQSAYQRSQASWMAYGIIDCMRANRTAAQNGAYNVALGSTPSGSGIANTDLTVWEQSLSNTFPAGKGAVTVQSGIATVTVSWDDSRGLGTLNANGFVGNAAQSVTIESLL
ncbi:MAG: type IV pilus modification protein PilV [Burkholderiales bacterium]